MKANKLWQIRNRVFYELKPFIPRSLQLLLRGAIARRMRSLHTDVWPINPRAASKPTGWGGWPGQYRFAFILMHDVETVAGQEKCKQLMDVDQTNQFRSLFSFVPEAYDVSPALRRELVQNGFEVGVHGLKHDGKLFVSKELFVKQAKQINRYLKEWKSVGFVSPSMQRNLQWMHYLDIEYDTSTFDTDPFEPEPEGVQRIFPFVVQAGRGDHGYVELPYTLPQDFTLFILLKETTIEVWKKKLDWIVGRGGMALFITHPDYMNFGDGKCADDEYPAQLYGDFLEYVQNRYAGEYWNPLPKEIAGFWRKSLAEEAKEFEYGHIKEMTNESTDYRP